MRNKREKNRSYPVPAPNSLWISVLLIGATLLAGCENTDERQLNETVDKLSAKLEQLVSDGDRTLEAVTNISSEQAVGEFKKLKQFEYRIAKLPLDATSEQQEQALNNLGIEGWECFDIVPSMTELRVFCRKRPDTPLRFVPNSVLGR